MFQEFQYLLDRLIPKWSLVSLNWCFYSQVIYKAIQSFWVDGTSEDLYDNFLSKEGPTSKLNQFVQGHVNFWKFPRREISKPLWASCPSLSEGTSSHTFNRSSFAIALCTSEKNVTPFSCQAILVDPSLGFFSPGLGKLRSFSSYSLLCSPDPSYFSCLMLDLLPDC